MEEEPEKCSLCGYGKASTYHAPVLVNLSTGEVGEMRVYNYQIDENVVELAPVQQTGTFVFVKCAGLTGQLDTSSSTFSVEISENTDSMSMECFCRNCRAKIAETSHAGYLVADLFDLENVKIYKMEEGTIIKVRDYVVSMCRDSSVDRLFLKVEGNAEGLIFVD